MKRAILLIGPLFLSVALVIAFVIAIRMNRPSAWQLELDQYIEYKASLSSEKLKNMLSIASSLLIT